MFSNPQKFQKNPQNRQVIQNPYLDNPVLSLILFVAILGLLAFNVYYHFFSEPQVFIPKENNNRVSESGIGGNLLIPINKPEQLSKLSRTELFSLRKSAISPYAGLIVDSYEPSDVVFGRVEDGLNWYSMDNFYRMGPSNSNHEKESAESLAVNNPLILVVPEFWGISIWAEQKRKWQKEIQPPSIEVLAPLPVELKWFHDDKKAKIVYDVTKHIEQANPYLEVPLTTEDIDFGVSSYNARDLGFTYMRFSTSQSEGINTGKGMEPIEIMDFLGKKNELCGMECNHRSNPMPEFDTFKVSKLPAQAVFELWNNQPVLNEENMLPTADFSFIIEVR